MKRFILGASLLLLTTSVFALGSRIVELGIDVNASLSNNYFTLGDIWNDKEDRTLVLDFADMASRFAKSNFALSGAGGVDTYLNVNLSKSLKLGAFLGLDFWANAGLPGKLINFIAHGNPNSSPIEGNLDIRAWAFGETGLSIFAKIPTPIGAFGVTFRPSYYMPIALVQGAKANVSFTTSEEASSEGAIRARGDISIPVYSAMSTEDLDNGSTNDIINKIMAEGGLDFSVSADYRWTNEWVFSAKFENIPIAPAQIRYKAEYNTLIDYKIDNLLEQLEGDGLPDFDEATTSSEEASEINKSGVLRPFKFGISATYNPFWFRPLYISPSLALGAMSSVVYIDFGLSTSINLGNFFFANASMLRQDEIWYQQIGLAINSRVVELEINLGMSSPSFLASYAANGLYVMVGLRVGY